MALIQPLITMSLRIQSHIKAMYGYQNKLIYQFFFMIEFEILIY